MYNPLISIVIPVYNGSDYLKEAIDSAINQTYRNIEIIVINDGSKDNGLTEKIALSYGSKIKYYFKKNGGVSSALNLGIEVMNGEWFSWLSHDDLYEPKKIEVQVNKLNTEGLDLSKTILATDVKYIDQKGEKIFRSTNFKAGYYNDKEIFRKLCKGNVFYGCSLLIPKKVLIEINGFKEEYKFIQDWICWLEIAMKKYNFLLISNKLVSARVHKKQQTKKIANLWPKEINDYVLSILKKVKNSHESKENRVFYIKSMFFGKCTSLKKSNVQKVYINELKEMNEFKFRDNVKYSLLKIKGEILNLLKSIYRSIFQIMYRS